MIDIERIIGSPDAEIENTTLTSSASPQALRRVHEEEFDDEDTIRDIIGPDYVNPDAMPKPVYGEIERFGRWANVTIGNKDYCISYVTPVAVRIRGEGFKITDRDWSTTTSNHMTKWAEEIGVTDENGRRLKYRDFLQMGERIPQSEISRMFREDAKTVDWTHQQRKKVTAYPDPVAGHKYVDTQDKIDLPRYEPPQPEF